MKNIITCPHCGDTWEYKYSVDHETGRSVITMDGNFVEDSDICTCFKCHKQYKIQITEPIMKMFDFVYQSWKVFKVTI